MRSFRLIILLSLLAPLLGGCWWNDKPASVINGECKIFDDPGFAVRGKRLKDNQWIGKTQEAGIEVCGWHRPKS